METSVIYGGQKRIGEMPIPYRETPVPLEDDKFELLYRGQIVDTFPTEEEAESTRNDMLRSGRNYSEDDFVIGRIEWEPPLHDRITTD